MKTVERDLVRQEESVADMTTVLDTTELRWFVNGRMPSTVMSWFIDSCTLGSYEERCDIYRMDGRHDVGVKLRSRKTPELKIRRSVGERVELPGGLEGPLEIWRKWSPTGERSSNSGSEPWVDVHKKIVKRRFSADGDEIAVLGGPMPLSESGCDVEVAAVSVGGIEAWTLAFAAFGPTQSRRDSIVVCWHALCAGTPLPVPRSLLGRSRGYSEWLDQRCGCTRRR